MIQKIHSNSQFICFNTELLIEPAKQVFEIDYWRQNNLIIGSAQGRGTTWFVQLNKLAGALRHYRRGGLFGKLIEDNYFFSGWEKTRSIAEFYLLIELRKAQVNVPRPIAARAIKKGLTYRADLLSEKIANANDLASLLETAPLSKKIYQKIGEQVHKMHHCQVNHSDLNIHNVLIDNNDNVWIIDFDKCKKQSGEHWKEANLKRLKRSFNKELKKRAINWSETDWLALIEGYKNQRGATTPPLF